MKKGGEEGRARLVRGQQQQRRWRSNERCVRAPARAEPRIGRLCGPFGRVHPGEDATLTRVARARYRCHGSPRAATTQRAIELRADENDADGAEEKPARSSRRHTPPHPGRVGRAQEASYRLLTPIPAGAGDWAFRGKIADFGAQKPNFSSLRRCAPPLTYQIGAIPTKNGLPPRPGIGAWRRGGGGWGLRDWRTEPSTVGALSRCVRFGGSSAQARSSTAESCTSSRSTRRSETGC